jgi:hypothetical protein
MTDSTLIAALRAAGVDVSAEDALPVVLDRVQRRIVRVVTTEREAFEQPLYARLMELWTRLHTETEQESPP